MYIQSTFFILEFVSILPVTELNFEFCLTAKHRGSKAQTSTGGRLLSTIAIFFKACLWKTRCQMRTRTYAFDI